MYDPVDAQINQISEGKKYFLASYAKKAGLKDDQNLYLQSIIQDEMGINGKLSQRSKSLLTERPKPKDGKEGQNSS